MTEFMKRATMGLLFTFCAWALIQVNLVVWALLPAAAGVYLLGTSLWDVLNRNY